MLLLLERLMTLEKSEFHLDYLTVELHHQLILDYLMVVLEMDITVPQLQQLWLMHIHSMFTMD